mmetsp:Transcript_9641/g.13262  ORF Transcript_9641/g.13262 Transcript_9641/m.13262 type:complete len:123 (+) Transcript_9641:830-1198(+)
MRILVRQGPPPPPQQMLPASHHQLLSLEMAALELITTVAPENIAWEVLAKLVHLEIIVLAVRAAMVTHAPLELPQKLVQHLAIDDGVCSGYSAIQSLFISKHTILIHLTIYKLSRCSIISSR